jgi:hypothetical protein
MEDESLLEFGKKLYHSTSGLSKELEMESKKLTV